MKAKGYLDGYLTKHKRLIDKALARYLPGAENYPPVIFQAMGYSLFAGGKRIRPILCLAALEAVGAGKMQRSVLPVACALEMIHTYSLIHDDLPAMDDDDCRRGKPASHKAFGEDVAILAGDALLTEAFHLMSKRELMKDIPEGRILDAINEIAYAVGCFGMIGGQVVDVRSEGIAVDEDTLYYIHTRKTGALIVASIKAGALLTGVGKKELASLAEYGRSIGLMFQIVDDILNVEGDRAATGKSTGSDASLGKATFPSLFGLGLSRGEACEL
ncbi:MAG: polyprenyl synthetase family protein, partial [Syntrophales bacterium LBB04]|nr:polyprenyl synthetase family protein [Syntrophales bacterium LBB04]